MSAVTIREESVRQGNFYVPQFEVRIEGAGLPRDVLRDVTQLTYRDDIKKFDNFELTVNNWNPTTKTFKYIGSETVELLQGDTPESRRYRLFEPCRKKVEVRMGYLGNLRVMLAGNFTTIEPNFPNSGAPTLTVRGLNILHQLRSKKYLQPWEGKRDSEIAESIARKKRRFLLPIVTDSNAKNKEPVLPYVAQNNEYDIDFLFSRARQRGYVVFILEPDPHGQGVEREHRLYFGPSRADLPELRNVTFMLRWGVSLIDFKPTLTTANQIRAVTVNGWNRATKKPISESVTLDDKRLNINRDLHEVLNSCDPREDIVVDEPVFTPDQAQERALAILMERQKEMVKASATCVGLPDLRAGQQVKIEGVGSRFSGTYFVTDTTHTISDSGYTTRFNARREHTGSGSRV